MQLQQPLVLFRVVLRGFPARLIMQRSKCRKRRDQLGPDVFNVTHCQTVKNSSCLSTETTVQLQQK